MGVAVNAFLLRYLNDPREFEKSLASPVLLFEARGLADDSSAERELATGSGPGSPLVATGEPSVFLIKKRKDNAFPGGVTVGRTKNNDCVIDDASVSRFHCYFQGEHAHWELIDAGSKNGTFVNGIRLSPKKGTALEGKVPLKFGEVTANFLSPSDFVRWLKDHAARTGVVKAH